MLSLVGLAAGAFGTGFVSALFPPVNAEAAIAIGVSIGSVSQSITWVIGLAVGQTAGKIVTYEAARAGRRIYRWHRANKPEVQPPSDQPQSRWQRFCTKLAKANQRLKDMMDGRWRTALVMFLSASIGLPPLMATAILAGLIKQHRLDFVLTVLAGRLLRFAVIALPFIAL
ncbi:MAG: hypothetical protein FWG16_00600 [Micrococcales bacterium]|nr:hypothetical protein [Micrococcales bacterium]